MYLNMEEHTYHTYFQYLDSGKYPEGLNKEEKRDIRKKCEPFCVQEGYLITNNTGRVKFSYAKC